MVKTVVTGIKSPYNNKVAVVGDSVANANSYTDANVNKILAKGTLANAAYLGRQRWTFDPEDNFGVPGDDTAQVLARIDSVLASSTCAMIVLDCGTNDEGHGLSVAQTKANYSAIINAIVNAGRMVTIIPPRPRDITTPSYTMTATQYLRFVQRRQWMLGLADPSRGILVCDVWRYFADPSSTNGAPVANSTYDGGLHPNQYGGYLCGLALAELFGLGRADGIYPFIDVLCGQNTDLYDATNNPTGCLNTNPMLIGGATIATGYTNGTGGGLTNTATKVTSGNRVWQQIALTGTATSSADVWACYQTLTAGNIAVGDVVEGYCDLEVDSAAGVSHIGLSLIDSTGFVKTAGGMADTSDINSFTYPVFAHSGVLKTPKFVLPTTTIRAGIKARSINTVTAAATFRVGAMSFRKII